MVNPKLLDQVRNAIRTRHLSYRTEQAYRRARWFQNNFSIDIALCRQPSNGPPDQKVRGVVSFFIKTDQESEEIA